MTWTGQQQRMLAAMGLSPMHRRTAVEALRVAEAMSAIKGGASVLAAPVSATAPVPRPGALLAALRRAAGGRDIADLVADIERLRRDPALKRALWPRLRALRRH